MRFFLFVILAMCSIQSCELINALHGDDKKVVAHTPPKRAGKYPKFDFRDSLKGHYGINRNCYDVTYYNLEITPDMQKKSIKGRVGIYLTAKADFDSIQLDLDPAMKINAISFEGNEITYSRVETCFFPKFSRTIKPGEKIVIDINFAGKPMIARKPPWEGGMVWKKDKSKKDWVGIACEYDGAGIWWPCKEHIADEPDSVEVSIETPKDLVGVSNGQLKSIHETEKSRIHTWHTTYAINPYNITFYIGDFKRFALPCKDCSIDSLTYYVLPRNFEKAQIHFTQTADIFKFYEDCFGKYPWTNDGFKLVESPFEGMEHQTAIAYGNGYKPMPFVPIDYIILHESAHEWWGNSVSVADFADIWIHEGIATYSEALYIEKVYGKEFYEQYITWQGSVVNDKFPVVGPYHVRYWDYKDSDPYMKGSVVLSSLRNTINNDSVFFQIIRKFYAQHQKSFATTNEFIDLVNLETGENYDWFFKQFFFNRLPPRFAVFEYRKKGKRMIQYQWQNVNDDFKMPAHFMIGEKEYTVKTTTKMQEIEVDKHGKFLVTNYKFYYEIYFSNYPLGPKRKF